MKLSDGIWVELTSASAVLQAHGLGRVSLSYAASTPNEEPRFTLQAGPPSYFPSAAGLSLWAMSLISAELSVQEV
tara:strand:- start:177 stop:401 length:225 start_codon:yes stop_codon:yes gene_type:complete